VSVLGTGIIRIITEVNIDLNIVVAEKALRHEDLQEAPLLIFANKQVEIDLSVIYYSLCSLL
jgi:hypothetical protein